MDTSHTSPRTFTGLVTPDQVCEWLGVSRSTLDRLRQDDPSFPPPVALSQRTLRWKPEDVDRWINRKKVRPTGPTVKQGARRTARRSRR